MKEVLEIKIDDIIKVQDSILKNLLSNTFI